MKTAGQHRREILAELCPPGEIRVDVGADHGHVARSLGAIATERRLERIALRDGLRWVIADGLKPFRRVDVAVIAGMGAASIAAILREGPTPAVAVLHAQDDPQELRLWLAANGWRIDEERLAREGRGIAEIVRALPGEEPSSGMLLRFGPRLLSGEDPLLREHLRAQHERLQALADRTRDLAPARAAELASRAAFLAEQLGCRGWAL